jgi:hypothetical protein
MNFEIIGKMPMPQPAADTALLGALSFSEGG